MHPAFSVVDSALQMLLSIVPTYYQQPTSYRAVQQSKTCDKIRPDKMVDRNISGDSLL